jgi:hypothetical protein
MALLTASLAQATLVVPLDTNQMIDRAHWIGVATCTSVRSAWEGKQIWTEVSFRVDRPLKGGAQSELKLRQLGGRVNEPVPVAMQVAGAAEFTVGETDLLFLEAGPDGSRRLVGFSQGKVPLHRDAAGELRTGDGERLEALVGRIESRLKSSAKP